MHGFLRTAVLAAAEEGLCRMLPGLLAGENIALEAVAPDGEAALEAVRVFRPDLLIADQYLPVLDGAAVLERVCSGEFAVTPARIMLFRQELLLPERAKLESTGAVLLCWPAGKDRFRAALESLSECRFPEDRSKRAETLLDALGVPQHAGRQCLRLAVLFCAEDERLLRRRSAVLYPMVGQLLDISPAAVERNMRHAIGAAWQSDKFDNQVRIFADTVDAGRGQPTCGEMIARLADILRLEG